MVRRELHFAEEFSAAALLRREDTVGKVELFMPQCSSFEAASVEVTPATLSGSAKTVNEAENENIQRGDKDLSHETLIVVAQARDHFVQWEASPLT